MAEESKNTLSDECQVCEALVRGIFDQIKCFVDSILSSLDFDYVCVVGKNI